MTPDELERALARRFGRALTEQEREILELVETDPDRLTHASFWAEEETRYPWLRRLLAAGAVAAAVRAIPSFATGRLAPPIPAGAATVEDVVVGAAEGWAKDWAGLLIKDITETTRARVVGLLDQFRLGMIDLETFQLALDKQTPFGPARAAMIARTESTRAQVAGAVETGKYLEAQGYTPRYIFLWDRIPGCNLSPTCGELDGQEIDPNDLSLVPPRHVNCMCRLNTVFDVPVKMFVTHAELEERLARGA